MGLDSLTQSFARIAMREQLKKAKGLINENVSSMRQPGGEFQRVFVEESFGDNAGVWSLGDGQREYSDIPLGGANGYIDQSGRIITFSNAGDLSQDLQEKLQRGELDGFSLAVSSGALSGKPDIGEQVVRILWETRVPPPVLRRIILEESVRRYNAEIARENGVVYIDPTKKIGTIKIR